MNGQCCDPNNINTRVCCVNAYDGHEAGIWAEGTETCCAKNNKSTQVCCEANNYHWVDKVTMVKTDDANGMCCIEPYKWFNDEGICCNKDDQPSGSGNQVFCCHSEFIKNGKCCTNDNKTWKTDSKACCEANKHHWVDENGVETDDANGMCCEAKGYHWVDRDTMKETSDANGMCCIGSYEWFNDEGICCHNKFIIENENEKRECCTNDNKTWKTDSKTCCEANEGVWYSSIETCCDPNNLNTQACCEAVGRIWNVFEGTCCPSTATGVVDGECCTIIQNVQDTDTGEEVTICCDLPSPDLRCSFDLDTDIPDNEEDCSALGGIWIGASNQCCTPSLIETNTNACCSKTGGKWSEEEVCTPITTQDGCIEAGGTWIPGENKCCSEGMIYYNTDSCCTKSGYYWDDESQVCSEEASGDYNCTVTVTIPTDLGYCISAINGGISNLEETTYDNVYNIQKSGYYPTCLQYREGYPGNYLGVACGKIENVPWYYPAEKECSLNTAGECYRAFFFNECPGVGCYCSTDTYFKEPFPQQCVLWGSPSNSSPIRASGEEKAKAQLAAKSEPLKFCYLVKTLAEYFGASSPTGNSSGLLYIGKWENVNENENNLKNLTIGTDKEDGESKVTLGDDSDTKCNEGQVCSIASLGKGFIIENEGKQMKFLGKCVN